MRPKTLSIFSLIIFLSICVGYAQDNQDWKWSHQSPQGNTLRWVKMWDDNNWYIVGYSGTFMKTTDAGATWTFSHKNGQLDSANGNYESIYDAHFFDMNNGFVTGGGGHIAKTTDGGTTWTPIVTGFSTAITWYQIYFMDANTGYVSGTTSGRLAKTTDGGNTWTLNTTIASGTYYDVYTPNDTIVVVATTSGNVRRSTDGGVTWATVSTGLTSSLYALQFMSPDYGWAAGSSGRAKYTTDVGATWTDVSTGLPAESFYDIDFVTESNQTLMEGFEGTTFPPAGWKAVDVLGANVWNRSTTQAYSGAASAFVNYQSTGGEDWLITPQLSIVAGDSIKFWARKNFSSAFPPDSLLIRVSTTDTALASFGAPIIAIDVANLTASTWIQFMADLSAYAGQSIYIAFHHKDSDGNGVWVDDVEVGTPVVQTAVYLTGDAFNIHKTIDNGTTWTPVDFLAPVGDQPWTSTYYSTSFLDGKFVTVGANGLMNSVTIGQTPDALTTYIKAGTLYDVWAESITGNAIAVGSPGITGSIFDQIMYTTDGGANWDISTTTLRPSQHQTTEYVSDIIIDTEGETGEIIETDLVPNSFATFRAIDMINPTTGFISGTLGAVYRTTNSGVSWDSIPTPVASTVTLYDVDFVDANTGWIVGSSGTCYKTTDGGTTWTQQTATTTSIIYSISMVNANFGWLGGSSGVVNITTDGGTTWTAQTSGMGTSTIYGLHAVDVNTAYISGASGKITKTTDGGALWNLLTLPSAVGTSILYTVHFRDANYGAAAGSLGKVIYTMDGGATWTLDNTSGSTIYGVRVASEGTNTTAAYTAGSLAYVHKNSVFTVPVELSSFTANVLENTVVLNWSTASETNNHGFSVERKIKNSDWTNVAFIEGQGNTTSTTDYSFRDENLPVGVYEYRLRQIDLDGTYKYFNLSESVEIGSPDKFALEQNYPNPFNPSTKIKYSIAKASQVVLKIYNILGAEVYTLVNEFQEAGNYNREFSAVQDGLNLSSGVYFYRLDAGNFSETKKFILMK
ncbi:MAG: choice-of-anchor J domain-containing protein [Ignavibacteriales bacterium]|nr:MAG: choice-of-anchor J domain-containing protein [Ignavibacteriales bacterium]